MSSRWTEQLAQDRSAFAEHQSGKGARLITEAPNTGLVDMDPTKPDVLGSVERTGADFQQRLLQNPMDHLNKSPRDFANNCRTLYTQYGANFEFSVLLLVDDPLHFDARTSLRVEQSQKQARQYFGKARPIRIERDNQALYTLQIQVVGARVSDLIKDDLAGMSLAASVSSRGLVRGRAQAGLAGKCEGSQISGMSDMSHLTPVLTVADEISSGENRGILTLVSSATGKTPQTIAELAHTHGLEKKVAGAVGQTMMQKSTTLNPIAESSTGEDIFVVHPHLTDQVVIIPLWDELSEQGQQREPKQVAEAALASIALGVLATFGVEGVNQISTQIVASSNRGNNVPLTSMREINRS